MDRVAPFALRLPELVVEFIPAVLLAVHSTALAAFEAIPGCPHDLAVRAAAEVETEGGCTSVPATAVALGQAPFVAVRFDPAGLELAAVMALPAGGFGLHLAAPAFAVSDEAAALAQVAEAARLTGRRWVAIRRERIAGFGPLGWQA